MALNVALPLLIDWAPPGVVVEGVGGASNRIKFVNFWIAGVASAAEIADASGPFAKLPRLNPSFGTVVPWHAGSSLRSVGKMSLLIPISTLYASAEKSSSDLFCAFQPKRAIVPSLPFLFVVPEMVLPFTTILTLP